MIKRLLIKNYAIIEELEIDFSDKLTIITGETGAGKSILMGALGLIMGDRTETRVLHNPHRKCVVEGVFDVLYYNLQPLFDELDIDYDTEVCIRREITPSGKSRAYINDCPVRLTILRSITSKLIDLHRQFDTLAMHSDGFQLMMIDALAENGKHLSKYETLFKSYQSNKKELDKLVAQSQRANQELDFFQFQLEELEKAELEEEEQEKLEQELAILTNAEEIKRTLASAYQGIAEGEITITSQLQDMAYAINNVKKFHTGVAKLAERFDGLIYELQDIAEEFNDVGESTEYDEMRISEVKERLDLIYKLQTKHYVNSIEELLIIQEDLAKKVDNVADLSNQIGALEAAIDKQEVELGKLADKMTKKRKSKAPIFEKKIQKLLASLSMQHAQLKVDVQDLQELTVSGNSKVTFLFAANKGGRLDLIKNVASGGELSRLTLCAKSLIAGSLALPTLIFDEIDAGVSGDVAGRMGIILKDLAQQHQVITITHTPQIAAKADFHYFVYKEVKEEKTASSIRLLDRDARIQELAIMLSGNPPSSYAVSNAVDLLDNA